MLPFRAPAVMRFRPCFRWRYRAAGLLGLALAGGVAMAQETLCRASGHPANVTGAELPVAPGAAARLEGEIADPGDALIPGARVLLRVPGSHHDEEIAADNRGHFSFSGLMSGEYSLLAVAPGFEDFTSTPFTLSPGQVCDLGMVHLSIPAGHADAYVTMNRKEIATAELHAEEQQRILGFPDFYTSFVWNAAPLDAKQKFSLGIHATTDRMAFVTAGLVASAEQINDTFPEWNQDFGGFARRYGAAYADGFIGKFIGAALLPSVFRQDPRYFYMGPRGTTRQRLIHALVSGVAARGDRGRLEPNYSHILGNAAAGALSTVYHPDSNSPQSLALRNALLGTAGTAGVNVVREFLLKRFVRGGDVDANGMP